jgi:hypothetical protein
MLEAHVVGGGHGHLSDDVRKIMTFNKKSKKIPIVRQRLETLNGCTARGSLMVLTAVAGNRIWFVVVRTQSRQYVIIADQDKTF